MGAALNKLGANELTSIPLIGHITESCALCVINPYYSQKRAITLYMLPCML